MAVHIIAVVASLDKEWSIAPHTQLWVVYKAVSPAAGIVPVGLIGPVAVTLAPGTLAGTRDSHGSHGKSMMEVEASSGAHFA